MTTSIQACMRTFGFDYFDPHQGSTGVVNEIADIYSDPEFDEKYAYGYVLDYEMFRQEPSASSAGNSADLNGEYYDSLSSSEQSSYDLALYGKQTEFVIGESEVSFESEIHPGSRGCLGEAEESERGDDPARIDGLSQRLAELQVLYTTDPDLRLATARWSSCMLLARPDYEFSSKDDVYAFLDAVRARLQGLRLDHFEAETGIRQPNEIDPNEILFADGSGFKTSGETRVLADEDVDKLLSEEMKLFEADQDCEASVAYEESRLAVDQRIAETLQLEFSDLEAGDLG